MNAHTPPPPPGAPEYAAHAVYAPSSAHRWIPCTASASAIAQLGELESGQEAEQGTAAHEEIERVLGPCAGEYSALNAPGIKQAIDSEHPAAYGVALVVDYVCKLPPGKMWIEQRVRLTDEIWGRCDVAHWDEVTATLTIVDYKNGFVNVEAKDSEQLQIYAAGSIYTHDLPAKWIRLCVVQPNSIVPGPRIKQHVMSAESLFTFAQRVAAIPIGPLTFVAGEQCKYCPLIGRCPASADVLPHLGTAMAFAPEEVPADKVAMFLAMKKPVIDWFSSLEKAQTKAALAGKVAPGMKVVQTTTKRAWLDEDVARKLIVERFGVNALDPPTPAQAEKLGLDVSKLAAAPPGGPALAFESDKRPTWESKSVTEMFAGVTNAPR